MSRIGKKTFPVPKGVTITVGPAAVTVKGPKGELSTALARGIKVAVDAGQCKVDNVADATDRHARAMHGTTRALLVNMVRGVTEGFVRKLEIEGVGYGAKLDGKDLVLTLGFALPVRVKLPPTVKVEVPQPTSIVISGSDKQQVGLIAAAIRKLRKPEPYKGKGIKYEGEVIRRKAGKAFGSA
jgi:large subunit ribosomal protein L6